ncbi:SsrA-binding protein [subsurface metagenome]
MKKQLKKKPLAENRRARYDYEILDTFEAGLVLHGYEVKSIKTGRVSLRGAYVVIKDNEAYLINTLIPPYQPANTPDDYNPERNRKLLLNKSEIKSLIGKSKQKGLTLVPLKLYTKRGKIKLGLAVAKGKREIDKREKIKKREVEREIERKIRE